MKPNYVLKPAMEQLGICKLRAHQLKPVQSLIEGKDTVIIAATSSGKSTVYQLPALLQPEKLTLVIEPTLSLIYDQVQALHEHSINADYIDSGRKRRDVENILSKIQKRKLTFLYITPERLQNKEFQRAIANTEVYMIVVDECHCVTEWGYSFRSAYLDIGNFVDCLSKRPVICACSATLPEDRLEQVKELLHLKKANIYRSDLKRENLTLIKKDVTSEKNSLEKRLEERLKVLDGCIKKYHSGGSVVVYTLTTGYTDALYNYLNDRYPNQVARCHGQIRSESLKHKMELEFLQGQRKIMVATSAFGMGIDVPDVELVIHFNTPISLLDYIQQIGRGGRDQSIRAHCVLFYEQNGDDDKIMKSFMKKAGTKQARKLLEQNYLEMRGFLTSKNCMVQDILTYQGQTAKKTCKCCTNCARARRGDT